MLYRFHDFELDPKRFQLRQHGAVVQLPRQVFDLVHFLVRHHERPVTRNELASHVWGGRVVSDSSLSRTLFLARKALGDNPRQHRFIKTVHGRGYWFVAPVEVVVESVGDRGGASSRWPFVGREFESGVAESAVRDVVLGKSRVLLVVGEPGIGKSRFLREVSAVAAREGLLVCNGSFSEVSGAVAARGWAQVLDHLWGCVGNQLGSPRFAEALAALGVHGAQEDVDRRYRHGDDVVVERARALDSASGFIRASSRILPILICLDDLHRADEVALDLLALAVDDAVGHSLMIVGTAREPDPGSAGMPPRLVGILRKEQVRRLPLRRLDSESVRDFLAGIGVDEVLDLDFEELHQRSGGNPFYLSQLVSVLLERRRPKGQGGQLPPSVRALVLTHLEGLDQDLLQLLRVSSVAGREFSEAVVAQMLGASRDSLGRSLVEAEERGVVEGLGEDVHRFSHVLVQEALYSTLSADERRAHHLRLAEVLGESGVGDRATLSAVAHHRAQALPAGDIDAAIDAALAAARACYGVFSLDQAAAHCRAALALVEKQDDLGGQRELAVRLELARSQLASGMRDEGRRSLGRASRLAASLGEGRKIADVALSIAPGFLSIETGVVDELLVDNLDRALDVVGAELPDVRARLAARLALALYWSSDHGRVRSLCDESSELARQCGDSSTIATVEVQRAAASWRPSNFTDRLAAVPTLESAARAARDHSVELLAAVLRVTTLCEAGDLSGCDRAQAQLARLVEDSGDPLSRWYPIAMRAMRALLEGRYEQARADVAEYSQLATRFGDANVGQTALMQLGEIAWQTGRAEGVVASVHAQADRVRATPEWRCALAMVLAMSGSPDAASEQADVVLSGFDFLAARINGAVGWAALVLASALLPDGELARRLYHWGKQLQARTVVGGYGMLCWGSRDFFVGLLAARCGRSDEAISLLEHSVEENAALGARPWQAHARVALAELFSSAGHERAARAHRSEAARLCLETGVVPVRFVGLAD